MSYRYDDYVKRSDFTFWFNSLHPLEIVERRRPVYFMVGKKDVRVALLITSVSVDYKENNQVTPHLGESFSLTMFGKTPATATIQGTLLDSKDGCGKNALVALYRDYLRPSAVARTKQMPVLVLESQRIDGPITNMQLTISGTEHGVWTVGMTMQIMRHTIVCPEDAGGGVISFDYTVGEDAPIRILRVNSNTKTVTEKTETETKATTVGTTDGTATDATTNYQVDGSTTATA